MTERTAIIESKRAALVESNRMQTFNAQSDSSFFSPAKRVSHKQQVASSSSATASTTTTTTTTVVRVKTSTVKTVAPRSSATKVHGSKPVATLPITAPKKTTKRKALARDAETPLPQQVKRLRTSKQPPRANSSANSSRSSSVARSSPEPIYRARSSSSIPQLTPSPPDSSSGRTWATLKDGAPGDHLLSSKKVVQSLVKSYKAYFKNPHNTQDPSWLPENSPTVNLEYPNKHAQESYLLLEPKDPDHYNPVFDLEETLTIIVKYYVRPEHRFLFGRLPDSSIQESSELDTLPPPSELPPNLGHLTPGPYLRDIQRAIHKRDGPLFMKTMDIINAMLRHLKHYSQPLPYYRWAVDSWQGKELPKELLLRIVEENYQRCVGPHVPKLNRYQAFSSTVYGELMPTFTHKLVQQTRLKPNSLFLDLGSGVGNIVVQATLQSGCRSYGIEIMNEPASIANTLKEQYEIRCRMWGIEMGEVELEKGSMLTSPKVDELLKDADVVLVDNKVFEESLNEALKPKFLDLKEGALVISLKPFVQPSENMKVTDRNVDDIVSMFNVTEHEYKSGMVSWGHSGGTYYIHRVDRAGYAKVLEQYNSRRGRSRS